MGREAAHDLVYEAAVQARAHQQVLAETLPKVATDQGVAHLLPDPLVTAEQYLGEATAIVATAVQAWTHLPAAGDPTATPITDLATTTTDLATPTTGLATPITGLATTTTGGI